MTSRKEIDVELHQHLERLAAHLEATENLSPGEARAEAERRFGDPVAIAGQCVEPPITTELRRRAGWLGLLGRDLRQAVRSSLKNPGFSIVAVFTLALGIGFTTGIYSVFQGVLLKPLPFASPGELVEMGEMNPLEGVQDGDGGVSFSAFADWKERQTSFADVTAWRWDTSVLERDGEAVSLAIARADVDLFNTLGLSPVTGRFFEEGDAVAGQRPGVVVLSFNLWRDRFGADPAVVGTSISLNGMPREIIGVMQPEARAPGQEAELWMPMEYRRVIRWDRHRRDVIAYGRLKPGVTLDQAAAEMNLIAGALEEEFPDINENWRVWVAPLTERVIGDSRPAITVAFAAVALVLIVACVNIANLFLARAATRQHELGVRTALGASTRQLASQLLTESLFLSLLGAFGGFLVAGPLVRTLLSIQPDIIPRSGEVAVDIGAFAFAVGVALLTGVLVGLVPLRRAKRTGAGLQGAATRSVSAGRNENRAGNTLVAFQMTLTVVLLSGAALLGRSMWNLSRVDPGFQSDGRVVARLFLDRQRYDTNEKTSTYIRQVLEAVDALPGVTSAGASTALPMDPLGVNYDLPVRIEGNTEPANQLPAADFRMVSPDYFQTMGSSIVSGRSLAEVDLAQRAHAIVINETMARRLWEGADPLASRLQTPVVDWDDFEVVGVVQDTRYYGLGNAPVPEMYVSLEDWAFSVFTVVASTEGAAEQSVEPVRRAVLSLDPSQPAHSVVTMESLVSDSVASQRFYAVILGLFSAVALALSIAGVYGVISYWVNRRTREIGVRLALGADRRRIFRLVLGRGMLVTGIGAAVGFASAIAATRSIRSVLFNIANFDAATMFAVPVVLVLAALVACLVPAARAVAVDPVETLRQEG